MAKAKLKTTPTKVSPSAFLSALPDEAQRRDAKALHKLLRRVTGKRATMWGTSIVGYGKYDYTYESGREGTSLRIGFSPRKGKLVVYIMPGYTDHSAILARLGKHKIGKSCLYIRRLSDVDLDVLEELAQAGWQDMAERYGEA